MRSQRLLRDWYEIPDDEEVDLDDFEGHAQSNVFAWYRWKLQGNLGLPRADDTRWDAFMSFASERREEVAIPLADRLREAGVTVWIDAEQLRSGDVDILINRGLPQVSVGVILVSEEYLRKEWTVYELDGMLLSGVRSFVVIAYRLTPEGEDAVRDAANRLDSDRDITFVTLRSTKTAGLARRVHAAVRRSSRPGPTTRSRHGRSELVTSLVAAFKRAQPDPEIAIRAHRELEDRSAMAALLRPHGGDDDAIWEKLPEEVREWWDGPRPLDEEW